MLIGHGLCYIGRGIQAAVVLGWTTIPLPESSGNENIIMGANRDILSCAFVAVLSRETSTPVEKSGQINMLLNYRQTPASCQKLCFHEKPVQGDSEK